MQEFFRGSLSKNPLYSTDIVPRAAAGGSGSGGAAAAGAAAGGTASASSTIGGAAEATMRDMRDKIATDLDMAEAVRLCVRLVDWLVVLFGWFVLFCLFVCLGFFLLGCLFVRLFVCPVVFCSVRVAVVFRLSAADATVPVCACVCAFVCAYVRSCVLCM